MNYPRIRSFVGMLALAVGFGIGIGCSGSDSNIRQGSSGKISVFPKPVTFSQVPVGSAATKTLTIRNSGESKLRVFKTKFQSEGGASIDDLSISNLPDGGFTIQPGKSRKVKVKFAPKKAGRASAGVLKIFNSDPEYGQNNPLEVDIKTLGNSPEMRVSPSVVRFPRLTPGDSMTRTVTISNVGEAPLTVYDGMTIAGSSDFSIKSTDEKLPVDLTPVGDDEKREKQTLEVEIKYKPTQNGSPKGELVIKSNEELGSTAEDPSKKQVELNANADTPCLLVGSTARNLGAVPIGGSTTDSITVENCGTKPLRISAIEFAKNTSDEEFSLELGKRDGDGDGALDSDIVLENKGEKTTISVSYQPVQEGTDEATLVLQNNDPVQPEVEIDMVARGATGECPKTKLRGRPKTGTVWDEQVVRAAPLDYVLLDGSKTEDPDGSIEKYEWRTIEKPSGATVKFEPWKKASASNKAKRRIRLLVAGDYKIGLKVRDNDGFFSCEEAVLEISADPDEKVHVELTWENPKDPDQNDQNGDDVDVHLMKMGPGKWFKEPYDVYYDNPNNGSGSGGGSGIWNPESPSLDIDDRNSLGPENIQMDDPQDCQWYAVGVHYFEERYPPTYATVRIYLGENKRNLVYEKVNVKLEEGGAFWDVARIHWPSRRVLGAGRVYDDEAAVRGEKAKVTTSMKNSNLCTSQNLYSTQ